MTHVYVLQSLKNKRYYIGSTQNLSKRIKEHVSGRSKYTKSVLPIKLVFNQQFDSVKLARRAELWLKKQKDKKFLERIINEGKINKDFR